MIKLHKLPDITPERLLQKPEQFIKAGKALFTVVHDIVGYKYTYSVIRATNGEKVYDIWYVNSLYKIQKNNWKYVYIGTIFGESFRRTTNSVAINRGENFDLFAHIIDKINEGKPLPNFIKVYHANQCGRCGRMLTVPSSVKSGFGPVCIKHL